MGQLSTRLKEHNTNKPESELKCSQIFYRFTNYTSERVIWLGIARVCRYFSRAVGEGKYYTRVQCLAILPSHECNDRFTISKQCCLVDKLTAKQKPHLLTYSATGTQLSVKLALLQTTKEQKVCKMKTRVTLFTLESYLTA